MNNINYAVGPIPARAALTVDFGLPGSLPLDQLPAVIERDRVHMAKRPACGLYEDVRLYGRLMTCFANDKSGVDTGLRFERVPRGFRCPGCQHILASPEKA
jgi:hypothetical protein